MQEDTKYLDIIFYKVKRKLQHILQFQTNGLLWGKYLGSMQTCKILYFFLSVFNREIFSIKI